MTESFDQAETILRLHRRRDGIFDLPFADPPWEIMLTLFVAHHRARPMTVADVAAASALPPATASRWINLLADKELIEVATGVCDEHGHLVRLTAATLERMEDLLG